MSGADGATDSTAEQEPEARSTEHVAPADQRHDAEADADHNLRKPQDSTTPPAVCSFLPLGAP